MKFMGFEYRGDTGFGVLEGDDVMRVYEGDLFNGARYTAKTLILDSGAPRYSGQPQQGCG